MTSVTIPYLAIPSLFIAMRVLETAFVTYKHSGV